MEPGASRRALDGIVVVLFETQNLLNIAGTIRAMKNFGLSRLRLVSPAEWDPWRIEGIAHDTKEIVAAARIYDSLEAALADCSYVAGLTARERRAKRAVARPRELAPELLERALRTVAGGERGEGGNERAAAGPVAILFGREDRGLPNDALDLCHRTVVIPTNPDHPSLNLAQAVLLTAYELWMAAAGGAQPFRDPRHVAPPASIEQLEQLFGAVERALWAVDFFKARQTESVMRTLRELAHRAELDAREASFLRAISIEVVKYIQRTHEGKGS